MNNPIAKKESIISKVKKAFTNSFPVVKEHESGHITATFVGCNNAIPICAEACACCWDRPIPESYEGKAEYVAKRSRIGHTSVLEHSNFVMLIEYDEEFNNDIIDFLSWCHYLQTTVDPYFNNRILLYGSFRAYADLYRETKDLNNPVLKAITNCLYDHGHSAAFEDICSLGLLDKSRFKNVEPVFDEDCHTLITDSNLSGYENEYFKIVGIDDLSIIKKNIIDATSDIRFNYSPYDLTKMGTITVLFKNMSRTCTHQLVRHRNGVTQESQRYVDFSDSSFSSPELFKPDKYDKDHKYRINFGSSGSMEMTLNEIGGAICNIYNQLRNPAITGEDYALLKEDARAFLPGNVQCKKIYMTFTYKNFLKFLNLREDKHAQAEIRMYATKLGDWFRENVTGFSTKEICDSYTLPILLINNGIDINVDESIGEIVEETIPTVDDYIRYAGLNNSGSNENLKEEIHNGSADNNV